MIFFASENDAHILVVESFWNNNRIISTRFMQLRSIDIDEQSKCLVYVFC